MSIIVSSGESICNNLQNHSKAKQMYTFPKDTRFKEVKKTSSNSFFYNIPPMVSKRMASIGYGTKSDFTKYTKSAAPYYQVKRLFDTNLPSMPSYSMGIGRSYYGKVVVNNAISDNTSCSPGPAKYNYLKPFGYNSPKFSIPKNRSTKASIGYVDSPGPAKYINNLNINGTGHYVLSKFSNSRMNGWSLSRSKRFKYTCIYVILYYRQQYPWSQSV